VGAPRERPRPCQTAQADHIQPGFNLFSVEQDIEVGRQSAAEAERQLPLLRDASLDRYLNDLIQNLARNAPGARYPYQIKAVNSTEINAMSLPGGPMYVNRGLIQAARNEAELAGVLSHEMAHVALRHGTHQASKAYLGQAGIGILGGLLGRGGGNSGQIINAIGGLGLNAVFLKFSRDAEYQADAVGAEIMAKSGYSPLAMASFFELLRSQQKSNASAVATFFSDHPAAADREARIRTQAQSLQVAQARDTGAFQSIKARPASAAWRARARSGRRCDKPRRVVTAVAAMTARPHVARRGSTRPRLASPGSISDRTSSRSTTPTTGSPTSPRKASP
jgi:beta-barrel assembly-enhancing protease